MREFTPATISLEQVDPSLGWKLVVWLYYLAIYAGGVSLTLPDVQFGTVSQDWITNDAYKTIPLS